jgi:hypothetical protein
MMGVIMHGVQVRNLNNMAIQRTTMIMGSQLIVIQRLPSLPLLKLCLL